MSPAAQIHAHNCKRIRAINKISARRLLDQSWVMLFSQSYATIDAIFSYALQPMIPCKWHTNVNTDAKRLQSFDHWSASVDCLTLQQEGLVLLCKICSFRNNYMLYNINININTDGVLYATVNKSACRCPRPMPWWMPQWCMKTATQTRFAASALQANHVTMIGDFEGVNNHIPTKLAGCSTWQGPTCWFHGTTVEMLLNQYKDVDCFALLIDPYLTIHGARALQLPKHQCFWPNCSMKQHSKIQRKPCSSWSNISMHEP